MAPRLQTYLDLVGFRQLTDDFEQIKHLLYYITVVAGIRQDMTAKVIASRLAWLKKVPHEKIKEYEQHVEDLIRRNSDIFEEIPELDTTKPVAGRRTWDPRDPANTDRRSGETAYALYDNAIKQLDKEADEIWYRFVLKSAPRFRVVRWWWVVVGVTGAAVIVAGLIIACLAWE